jgi:uncharacterized repeat protein (TIGR01451 family)
MIAAATILPAMLHAWGPDRPTYTIENPADHVTFNSITNNPNIGDERNFVGIRESGTQNLWTDNQQVQAGKTYTVRVFVHNNAATSLNASGKGIAKDVVANVNLPTTTGKSIQVDGMVSSSNAQPTKVWDQAVFSSSKDFNLALVPGTLKYENNKGVFNLPESLLTATGAKLGYDKMDGNIPGCFQYSGYVSFQVKPQFAPTNAFEATKQVRKAGQTTWSESVNAKPGETVEYQLKYKNTGEIRHNGVLMQDYLPKGLDYVPGSSYLMNGTNPNGIKISDNVTTPTGINVGDYNPQAAAYVKFSAKVDGNDLECGTHKLTNKVRVTASGGYKEDTADVVVDNGVCQPPVPKYTCDALTVTKISRTEFRFNTAYTVENATFKSVTYVIRDAAGKEISRSTNPTYTQTQVGKYTVQAIVTVTVNGVDKTVTGENCKKPFEVVALPPASIEVCELATKKIIIIKENDFDASKHSKNLDDCKEEMCPIPGKENLPKDSADCKETPVTPVVPTTPTELPETGPAEAALSIVGLGSMIASVGYYTASRRALLGR